MPFTLGLTVIHTPDGSTMTITQESFERDIAGGRDVFTIGLKAERTDGAETRTLRGMVRLSGETLRKIPGTTDPDKARSMERALIAWLIQNPLTYGFRLRAVILNGRVEVSNA